VDWRFAQDVVWEKHNGSGPAADRFRRVHDHATHWYQGKWSDLYNVPPTTPEAVARTVKRTVRPPHRSTIGGSTYVSEQGGPRQMRSVIYARSEHGNALNETQKPLGIVEPLILHSCPPGGLVLDPFAGSGTTLVAARALGRRAIGVESRESQCEAAALRLSQGTIDLVGGA
jgi:site-specific DNA-methyltransferase (adenine-specific)